MLTLSQCPSTSRTQLPSYSRGVVAAAGSGKTEFIVDSALAVASSESVLITTFTESGTREIRRRVAGKVGRVPDNITIIPWFTFLIAHGAKPYQNPVIGINKIAGLNFESLTPKQRGFPKKRETRKYYLDRSFRLYRDFLSEFVLHCDDSSGGAVMKRMANVFSWVYFDEIQDISGRDFELFERMLSSGIHVCMVGDPRQGTFSTTQSRTNRGMTRSRISIWLAKLEKRGLITVDHLSHSYRCNPAICELGDSLYPQESYPGLSETESRNPLLTGHDGIFLIQEAQVAEYIDTYRPQLLVWNKAANDYGSAARNMGEVKGLTFDRVLIQPTEPIRKYFRSGSDLTAEANAKLYVAVTRARFSVGLILDRAGSCEIQRWKP